MAEINIPIKAEIQDFLDKLGLVKKDIDNISTSAKEAGETISKTMGGTVVSETNKATESLGKYTDAELLAGNASAYIRKTTSQYKEQKGIIEELEKKINKYSEAQKKSAN